MRGGVTLDMYNELQLEVMKLRSEHSRRGDSCDKLAEVAGVESDRGAVERDGGWDLPRWKDRPPLESWTNMDTLDAFSGKFESLLPLALGQMRFARET